MMKYSAGDHLFFLVTRASLSLTARLKKILAANGLKEIKPSYLGVLMRLWEKEAMDEVLGKFGSEDGIKLSELGRSAGVEPSTVTGILDRMERDGLVFRSPVPGDRRAQQANLTEKGRSSKSKVQKALKQLEEDLFRGIAQKDAKTAKGVLQQIIISAGKNK